MKRFLYLFTLLTALSCDKPALDTVAPEYADWYVLKSPIDKEIQGVWGDIDKTLLISTMDKVFRSTDRGQTWQPVHQQSNAIFGFVQYNDTLFTMNGQVTVSTNPISQYLVNADKYSTDDGLTWKPYKTYGPPFDMTSSGTPTWRFPANPVRGSSGTSYKINRVYLGDTTGTIRRFETPGVVTSTGRRIDLPQLHQLNSLYLDDRERLYITGSDAVCGRGAPYSQGFSFCNSKNGRGVVYVSKNPLP